MSESTTMMMDLSTSISFPIFFSRVLQANGTSPDKEQGNFNHYAGFLFWYILLLLCCIIPTTCEWRRRYQRERMNSRLTYLNHMAANRVAGLGSNVPDAQDADERHLSAKMSKVDAATQITTMVVTSKDLVVKPHLTLTSAADRDDEAPDGMPSSDVDDTTDNADLEDGELFAALRLLYNDPNNAKNRREVPPSCAICLCSYEVDDSVTFSPNEGCVHAFHKECIRTWMAKKKQPLCPCCRQEFCSLEGS